MQNGAVFQPQIPLKAFPILLPLRGRPWALTIFCGAGENPLGCSGYIRDISKTDLCIPLAIARQGACLQNFILRETEHILLVTRTGAGQGAIVFAGPESSPCAAGRRTPAIPCGRPSRNALCRSRCIWDASKTGLWIPLAIARQSACLQYFVSWEIGYIPLTSDALGTILSPCAILSQALQLPAFPV